MVFLFTGCATVPPQSGGAATLGKALLSPLKSLGEKTVSVAKSVPKVLPKAKEQPTDALATLRQPDNPAAPSTQNLEVTLEETIDFAAPTQITITTDGETKVIQVPAGSKQITKETRKAGQTIGAAQKDTARADAAWLASFRWVQGVGVLVFLAGVLGFAHPAIRPLIGGKDTALVVGLAGLTMIFGPAVLQKYGDWFALAILGAAAYWFVSRAKHKEGQLDSLKQSNQ